MGVLIGKTVLRVRRIKHKHYIIECDKKTERKIEKWGTNIFMFSDFLKKHVGLSYPIRLTTLSEGKLKKLQEEYSVNKDVFECVDGKGNECFIELLYGLKSTHETSSILITTKDGETAEYVGKFNTYGFTGIVPDFVFVKKVIQKPGKTLTCKYGGWQKRVKCSLKFNKSVNCLEIVCQHKSNRYSNNTVGRFQNQVLQNNFENYLLGLENDTVRVLDVFDELIRFFGENIADIYHMHISFKGCILEKERVLDRISISEGKIGSVTITENEETFTFLTDSNNWIYSTENIQLTYNAQNDKCEISITGEEKDIDDFNREELLPRIKQKVLELRETINKKEKENTPE